MEDLKTVSGEDARRYHAIRLDSYRTVNNGPLTSANVETGEVKWKDSTGNDQGVTLGPQAIRIVPNWGYGR